MPATSLARPIQFLALFSHLSVSPLAAAVSITGGGIHGLPRLAAKVGEQPLPLALPLPLPPPLHCHYSYHYRYGCCCCSSSAYYYHDDYHLLLRTLSV